VILGGDAATNLARLRSGPIHEHVIADRESLEKLAGLDFEVAAFSHGRAIRARRRTLSRSPALRALTRPGRPDLLSLLKNRSLTAAHRVVS
jgi:hypothetical protein